MNFAPPPRDGGGLPAGLGDLFGALGGGQGGLDAIWSNPMVTGIAFHPSKAEPAHLAATDGPVRDGSFDVTGGDTVSYRLYLPPKASEKDGSPVKVVGLFFHGNAEVCTNADDIADVLTSQGAALLSIDYRGYAWGTGQPSLTKLCSDTDECFTASQKLLQAAGCGGARCVAMGRSIGATCAVHLASHHASHIHGLVVDSGLMSIKQLPLVQQFAPMLFGGDMSKWEQLREPFDTLGKLAAVSCPVLVMHGDKDEIVPLAQAQQCHAKCAAQQKKLQVWPGAGHNNVGAMYGSQWASEIEALLCQAIAFENAFPAGATVETHSLSSDALNGLRGRVLGPQGERLRVDLGPTHGPKALKPANLRLIEATGGPSDHGCGEESSPKGDASPKIDEAVAAFPAGVEVEAHSLSSAALNGQRGKSLGPQGARVRVEFPEPHGIKAILPAKLKIIEPS